METATHCLWLHRCLLNANNHLLREWTLTLSFLCHKQCREGFALGARSTCHCDNWLQSRWIWGTVETVEGSQPIGEDPGVDMSEGEEARRTRITAWRCAQGCCSPKSGKVWHVIEPTVLWMRRFFARQMDSNESRRPRGSISKVVVSPWEIRWSLIEGQSCDNIASVCTHWKLCALLGWSSCISKLLSGILLMCVQRRPYIGTTGTRRLDWGDMWWLWKLNKGS